MGSDEIKNDAMFKIEQIYQDLEYKRPKVPPIPFLGQQ